MKLFSDPRVRLVARALLAGVITAATMVNQADDPFSSAVWKGAVVAGFWTFAELVSPLNALLGWWKNPS